MSHTASSQSSRFLPRDAKGLEERMRNQFPLIFGDKDLVPTEEFVTAYKDMAEFTSRSAEPPFKSETHKQQGALAAASLGLIALILFQVGAVKIGDAQVTVNDRVLVWYAAFLAVMLIVFCLRAFLDIKRAKLALAKDADKPGVLTNAVQMAFVRRNIQYHFWLKLFDGIGARYEVYTLAQDPSGATRSGYSPVQAVDLNFAELRKVEELRQQIDAHESFVDEMLRELGQDVERFENRVLEFDTRAAAKAVQGNQAWDRYTSVKQLFENTFEPWFEARNQLSSINLGAVTDMRSMREAKMLDAQLDLLKRAQGIRRMYAFTELVLPVMLAVGAILYVWFSR